MEVRVHLGLDLDLVPLDYVFMQIELARVSIETCDKSGNNRADKSFGSAWLRETRSAVLSVPSVLVPGTRNYLINPAHPDFASIEIIGLTDFQFDPRLIRGTT